MIYFEEDGDFQAGALMLVDKPLRWTSFDVVNKVRSSLRARCGKIKVGHAGTLDPLATGLVLVCTGKWTKRIEEFMAHEKEYIATIRFGATTPSYDLEKEIDATYPYEHIDINLINRVLPDFMGRIMQSPPLFSAIRIDGQRAYEKARAGSDEEPEARKIEIMELEVLSYNQPDLVLRIRCGKGTYIRSLARDLGRACGSGAHLIALRRTKNGEFDVAQANNLDDLVAKLREME
ncbi:MAG: tRNA pseudouridine(55) synthase TruB [Marinifilaceae bacterium]|nr:tRNA pseudouridine(55) synthase TruB [Marinifilaceae bacterium]